MELLLELTSVFKKLDTKSSMVKLEFTLKEFSLSSENLESKPLL